ncbi:hypothetical protein ASE49_02140 [Novosphingobium sp. Leaf2]|nr:hypothetical protein ASE49_02140 [Novosphingobium sp. Leaf2]
MRYGGTIAVLALALGACGGSKDTTTQASASAPRSDDAPSLSSTQAPPPAPPAKARTEKQENALYEFGYAYPAAVSAIAPLRKIFDDRLDQSRTQLIADAREGKADADKDQYPYHPFSRDTTWKVVADLPQWLSLSAEFYEYSNGAHGNSGFDTLLWDRRAQTARQPLDMFVGKDMLRSAIQGPFCDALDKERAKKRGEPVTRGSADMFSDCIDPTAQTLILGSSNGQTFDRIGLLVAPYEAGPYAEGSYEVTLPVTGKVMAALKPQYRSAFSIKP